MLTDNNEADEASLDSEADVDVVLGKDVHRGFWC